MNESWIEKFEKKLEKKLEEFLSSNPYQDLLLQNQTRQDESRSLVQQQILIQQKAEINRLKLLSLAELLKQWVARSNKAKTAGALELAQKADEYIQKLMAQGREVWDKLDELGIRFKEIEKQLINISQNKERPKESLEEDWNNFETELQLEELKRKRKQ